MMPKHSLSAGLLAGLLGLLWATVSPAAIQSSENFDTGWPNVPWASGPTLYPSNAVNTTTQWQVQNMNIASIGPSPNSTPYRGLFPTVSTNSSWIASSMLSNGIGSVQFVLRNGVASQTITLGVESSYETNAVNWVTNAIVTNTINTAWTSFIVTNLLNPASNQIIRLRKYSSGSSGLQLGIDDIVITHTAGSVTLASASHSPTNPADGEPVSITATLTRDGVVDSLALTNYWREWPSNSWTAVAMVSNSPTQFTASNGIPGKPIGTIIDYYAAATYTTIPVQQTNTAVSIGSTNRYLVRPLTSYTNLAVTGALSTNLTLTGNYAWHGVVPLTSLTNGAIQFQGTRDSGTTTWGDTNQTAFSMPIYGTAETGTATSIVLFGTNTGYFAIDFNEGNRAYTVQPCTYTDFAAWSNSPFGSTTNSGWVLSDGQITNDATHTFRDRFALLNGSPNASTNSFLMSPYLSNGVGQISFWYRNWETNATPTGTLQVQVAPSASSTNWTTISNIVGITSPNYRYFTVGRSDRDNNWVRIVNNPSGNTARICLDEVAIADAGAGVLFTNVVHAPSPPVCTNPVTVQVNINPVAGAAITNVILRYRTTLTTNSVIMTNTAANLYTGVIPAGQGPDTGAGLVQYDVACYFTGFASESASPLYTATTNFVISRSYLTLTNVTLLPNPPVTGTNIQIAADILPRDGASNITATAFYRVGFSGAFTSNAMAYSGTSNRFVTTNGIPPVTLPGTPIYYAITATCQGGNPIVPTNYPAAFTNTPLVAYMRTTPPLSSYSNLAVTGSSFSTNLLRVGNYSWQGVATLSNAINPTLRFAGVNAGTSYWGFASQTISNFPYYGTAVPGSTNALTLYGTNTGHFVFEFNETNQSYLIRRCQYLNFEQWTNAAPYGAYTNAENWVLSDGRTTTNSAADDLLRFQNAGRSGILKEGPSTNAWLLSPNLVNGTAQISFWYRNLQTNASPDARFLVQTADTLTSAWTTVSSYTNVLSQDYLYTSIASTNWQSRYVRILNDTNTSHAALCLDEIVIADPDAKVNPSNLTNFPANPTVLDNVDISVDLTPVSGALITNAIVWFRLGTNGMFDSLAMTNSGTHWSTATPIEHPAIGVLQYAIQYFFSGFRAVSPAFYPPNGTNDPAFCTVVVPGNTRSENFDTGWPNVPWGNAPTFSYSNAVNTTTKWQVQNMNIASNGPTPNSTPYRGYFPSLSTGASWIVSSMLSNGIGSVQFVLRNGTAAQTINLGVESSYETNAVNWVTNAIVTNTISATWTSFIVTNLLNPASNQIIRLRKYSSGSSGLALGIDDIVISYPPANVAISNVFIDPGYPSTADTVRVSCDVSSITPNFPAYAITPAVYYRRADDPSTNFTARPMTRTAGNHFETLASLPLPPQTRDVKVEYYIQCDFTGYHGSAPENKSPQYFPAGGAASPTNYVVRAFASDYGTVSVVANGANTAGRLLRDGTWQAVFTTSSTNGLTLSLAGSGYSTGMGYSTNVQSWGNSNNWQTALPLADRASTGQTAFAIGGSFAGQYVMRFDENTGEYTLQQCVFQDFDAPGGGNGTPYEQSALGSSSNSGVSVDFASTAWPANLVNTRTENFEAPFWGAVTNYTDIGVGGYYSFITFGMTITNVTDEGKVMQTRTPVTLPDDSFVGQASHWSPNPILQGIGTVSARFRALTTNTPASMAFYLMPTNGNDSGSDLNRYSLWLKPPVATNGISGTNTFTTFSWSPKTNATMDVIYSATQEMCIAELTVSDWRASNQTVNGWTAYQSWIESRTNTDNTCRFEASRSPAGTEQYLLSPAMTSGVSTINFQFCGTTTTPVSLNLEVSYTNSPFVWTNVLAFTNVTFNGSRADYTNVQHALLSVNSPIYVRIKNMTSVPGGLLIDNVQIKGFATSNDWYINSAAVNYQAQENPPAARQYYLGAGYLNSNRTSEVSTVPDLKPNTNVFPCIRTPSLAAGIGEISFWYRNWSTTVPTPARLVIEKSAIGDNNPASWTFVTNIVNIVNTNDYLFFSTSIYDTSYSYIRIYNDDTYTTQVGRVCLDDILVTAPLASSLSLSNLVITPSVPLYTDRVDVAVDVYRLFYAPSNLTLTAYYGTASNYAGLASAPATGLPMTCTASNLTVPGKWYRYTTTTQKIPTNQIDRYVKYCAEATFSGYHPEVNSPKTNRQFAVQPTWYNPLKDYTNNSAYYIVFSCPTGSVWINEFNITDFSYGSPAYLNQYIELCGKTGSDIRNWNLQVLDYVANTQAVYAITNTTLANATNGYGFWLIGKSGVAGKQQTLTNTLPTAGGIRLLRTSGTTADAICYTSDGGTPSQVSALTTRGFTYAYDDDGSLDTSVILTGYNTNGFTWTLGNDYSYSAGSVNDGQFFVVISGGISAPTVTIYAVWMNTTNLWIECSGTNSWAPAPWYSTNLLNTNGWTTVTPFWSTYPTLSPSNTYTVHFNLTNIPACYYRIVTTNAP